MTPLATGLSALVRGYRVLSRPWPSPCRFVPTCSEYALDALGEHGAARGSWLVLRRLLRCHPFHRGGSDPVPPRGTPRRAPRATLKETL